MGLLIKLILGLLVLGAAGGAGAYYYANGLNKIGLDTFDLRGINDVNAQSFAFDGDFYVKNPSKTPVPVQSITYDVILKETGETISSGTLPAFVLSPSDTTKLPFREDVSWVPTASLAATLATKSKVYVTVKGIIHLNLPEVRDYAIPFSEEADIKPFITQFVPVDTAPVTEITEKQDTSPVGLLS
jgi:LEA14-like dessication related protein